MDLKTLNKITGNDKYAGTKAGFLNVMAKYGGVLNEPAVFAQVLAQVIVETGGFKYTEELWGPTAAQRGYDGRADLGNVKQGDGSRFRGYGLIQVTGRANARAFTSWVRANIDPKAPNFEDFPNLMATPDWAALTVVWYFMTRNGLLEYARAGNNEMVTRRVNGGLNHYTERLAAYEKAALIMLGYEGRLREFQADNGLIADGITGPLTRKAMHEELTAIKADVPVASSGGIVALIVAIIKGLFGK